MASDISYYEDDSDDEAPDLIEVSAQDNDEANDENPANQAQNDNNTDSNIHGNAQNHDELVAAAAQHVCPVTILSGFLGSGKTTLIQYILKSPDHGKRIAVIENEFGEGLAIESLIARDGIDPGSGSLQDLIELPNGCVCCTVKDSLVETLECLIAKKSDLDYILIEASGMADPGPIASVFWLDEALESRLRLDGIVTLVDGRHILGQLEATEEAARQIAYADRILLNKVDLLEEDGARLRGGSSNSKRTTSSMPATTSIREVEAALRSIHPTAPILKTSFSKIPNLDWILDADCFSGFDHLEEVQTSLEAKEKADSSETDTHDHHHHEDDDDHHHHGHQHDENCSECCHGDDHHDHHDHHHDDHHSHSQEHEHTHDHQHEHEHQHEHKHTSSITTIGLEFPGSVDVRKLNAWLADILWPNQDETDTVLTAMLRQQETEGQAETNAAVSNTIRSDNTNTAGGTSETRTTGGHAPKQRTGHSQQQIFRIKGIVSILSCEDYEEEEAQSHDANVDADAEATPLLDRRRFIVQAVHDLWDIQPVTSKDLHWAKHEERTGKIVVIGKFLQDDQLREGFRACFV